MMQFLATHHELSPSAADIAEGTRLALPTVRKLLKQLSQAGLLNSSRGALGGYQLANHPKQISLADIIEAIDGPIALTDCCSTTDCHIIDHCHSRKHWQRINHVIKQALSHKSLAQFSGMRG